LMPDDGSLLASAGIDGTVHVWPVAGGPPRVLRGHRGSVKAVSFAPDGHWLASGSDDDHVRVWPLQPLPAPPEGAALRAWLDQATNINVARGRPAPR
jgi:WD40 repeat protein